MAKDRLGSNATRSSGFAGRAIAPRCRSKPREGFPRDVGASASGAARSSPRPGRAWCHAICCVWGRTPYLRP